MPTCTRLDIRSPLRGSIGRACVTVALLVAILLWPPASKAEETVPGTTQSVTVPHATDSLRQMQQREAAADASRAKVPRAAPEHQSTPPPDFPKVKKKTASPPARPSPPPTTVAEGSVDGRKNVAPPPTRSFQGLLDTGWIPPDTQGAVGPNHLMEVLNNGVGVFDKTTGEKLSQVRLQTFWSALGTGPGEPANDAFDPKVLYDQYTRRFVVVTLSGRAPPNSWLLIGVSATSDPGGEWFLYAIDADVTNGQQFTEWADFPGLGVDARHYYVTAKMRDFSAAGKLWVFPKTALFENLPTISFTEFRSSSLAQATQPAHSFGDGEAEYLVSAIWTIAFGSSPNALRVGRVRAAPTPQYEDLGFIAVQPYGRAPEAPQPDGVRSLETNFQGVLNAVFRGGRLWTAQHFRTGDGQRVQIGWYEIDPAEASFTEAGAPVQEGRVSDEVLSFYYPSIAVNRDGHAMIGFSGSSPTTYAGGYYTVREREDPLDSMQPVRVVKEGLGPYFKTFNAGRNRWGDYSATVIDPDDDRTFWTIQEYADTPLGDGTQDGQGRWGTWWASAKFGTYTVSVAKIGTGQGTIRSAQGEIDCGSLCRTEIGNGQSLRLTAEAATASTFAGWTGAGCSGTETCTVSADASVTATFESILPPPPAAGGGDSGGGCVLDPSGRGDLLLPATLVASLVYVVWRRRRLG